MHTNFHQHDYLMVTWQFFCKHAHLSLLPVPHVDFSICVVIQLFNSVSRHPYREYGILLIKSATAWGTCTLWMRMSLQVWWNSSKSLHSNRWKAVLVLSSLWTYDDIFFECFVASVSSGPFHTLISRLISCQLVLWCFDLSKSLASQTLSISAAVPITHQIWVLEMISTAEGSGL